MSYQAVAWAYEVGPAHGLRLAEQSVLVAVCHIAGPGTRLSYPSRNTLARMAGTSRATVDRALRRLVDARLLIAHPRHGRSTVYHVPSTIPDELCTPASPNDAGSAPEHPKTRVTRDAGSDPGLSTAASPVTRTRVTRDAPPASPVTRVIGVGEIPKSPAAPAAFNAADSKPRILHTRRGGFATWAPGRNGGTR